MTTSPPHQSEPNDTGATSPAGGALLNDEQVRWVKRAVIGMTAVLIAGFFLLIGRIIYLARGGATQAASVNAIQPDLLPEIRAALPAGAVVKSIAATGSRVLIHHASPGKQDELSVLDLTTGRIASHVVFDLPN